ncbi:MAG: sensor histidine kinase, partial [Frankia sp.]
WFFTEPLHSLFVRSGDTVIALVFFVLLALVISGVVERAARYTREATRARAEAATLSNLSGSLVSGRDSLPAVLALVRETFALTSATLLERRGSGLTPSGDTWVLMGLSGTPPCFDPREADTTVEIRPGLLLALRGRALPAADRSVLTAFATQAATALEHRRLAAQAEDAAALAATDRTRTALLAAVSHDLRTPLAAATAAVSTLRTPDLDLTEDDQGELLATVEESLDRLTHLVENLLDMSRLQAGALRIAPQAIGLDDVVPIVLDHLGTPGATVLVRLPSTLPDVHADPALLERVIANLTANALRYSPPEQPPLITASAFADRVELRVIDRGPGVPEADRTQIFMPFQRLGDRDNTTGVGLGLALSRGLAEAMDGTLTPEDTPGGGLTMVLGLVAADGTG